MFDKTHGNYSLIVVFVLLNCSFVPLFGPLYTVSGKSTIIYKMLPPTNWTIRTIATFSYIYIYIYIYIYRTGGLDLGPWGDELDILGRETSQLS